VAEVVRLSLEALQAICDVRETFMAAGVGQFAENGGRRLQVAGELFQQPEEIPAGAESVAPDGRAA
jgi:hypothetical protein